MSMNKTIGFLKMTLSGFLLFAVFFLLLSFVGCTDSNITGRTADEEYVENLERNLDATDATLMDVRTMNGQINVRGTTGTEVVVQIRKGVRAPTEQEAEEFAQKVEIHVERDGDQVRIYSEYPEPPEPIQVEVGYDIQCPARIDLRLEALNGGIDVGEIEGMVDANTANGSVDVRGMRGPFHLISINGNIDAEIEALEGEGSFSTINGSVEVEVHSGRAPLMATTTNGSVEVTLPAGFSGRLEATTVNGRARSDFPMSAVVGFLQTHLSGPLGEGGDTRVQLRTVNGNVTLKKR